MLLLISRCSRLSPQGNLNVFTPTSHHIFEPRQKPSSMNYLDIYLNEETIHYEQVQNLIFKRLFTYKGNLEERIIHNI